MSKISFSLLFYSTPYLFLSHVGNHDRTKQNQHALPSIWATETSIVSNINFTQCAMKIRLANYTIPKFINLLKYHKINPYIPWNDVSIRIHPFHYTISSSLNSANVTKNNRENTISPYGCCACDWIIAFYGR